MPQEDLVARVRKSQDVVQETQADFAAAFQLYQRLTAPQAVDLEELSGEFEDALEACQDRSAALAKRLEAIQAEAQELFKGWNEELTRFSGEALRKKSEAMLEDTQARTQRVVDAIERLRGRVEPVLAKLQDYALFFHHNLSARAIATLQDTYKSFDAEFRALEGECAKTQGEIRAFLENFEEPPQAAPAK
jgi:chromosome segregation ATPase